MRWSNRAEIEGIESKKQFKDLNFKESKKSFLIYIMTFYGRNR